MLRLTKWLLAAGALALASWLGLYADSDRLRSAATATGAFTPAQAASTANLPDTPGEWRGRIDYRRIDQQLAELAARPEMAGLAVAVVEDGRIAFVRSYGLADRATGARVTNATLFRWASVSKTATGTLAAALASEAALDLDAPLSRWRTSLRLPGGAQQRLSVAQLLAQQTGLTKNAYDEKLEAGQAPALLRASLAIAPLQCPPGTCHTYQNIAFDAASEILAEAAGQPMEEAIAARFFRPLGMRSARYGMAGLVGAKDWARPHSGPNVRPVKAAYWRVPAAAGIESNIGDLARWMQASMGEHPGVLPPAVLSAAQRPIVKTPRLYGGDLARALSDAHYGLGWRSVRYGEHRLIGHSGAVDGYRATMIFDPATRTGVVALWNSNWGFPFRIPFAVLDNYHRRSVPDWLDQSGLPPPNLNRLPSK